MKIKIIFLKIIIPPTHLYRFALQADIDAFLYNCHCKVLPSNFFSLKYNFIMLIKGCEYSDFIYVCLFFCYQTQNLNE